MRRRERSAFCGWDAAVRWHVSLVGVGILVLLLTIPTWARAQQGIAEHPPAKHVLDVRVDKGKNEDEVTISVDGGIEPNVFPFQGSKNPMVVVDIPGTTMSTKKDKIPVDSPRIKQVRIAQHKNPTKVRVVLDLLNEVAYDVVKLDLYLGDPEHPEQTPTRLVVTIRKAK